VIYVFKIYAASEGIQVVSEQEILSLSKVIDTRLELSYRYQVWVDWENTWNERSENIHVVW
jgi:hypothetical protein